MRITINPATGRISGPCSHSSCNRILPDGSRRCSRCGKVYRLGFILPDRILTPVMPLAPSAPAPYRLASGEATRINPYALTVAPAPLASHQARPKARKGRKVHQTTRIEPAAPAAPSVALQLMRAFMFPVILLLRFYGWVSRIGLKALGD